MKQLILSAAAALLIFGYARSGIYRHDVPLQAYLDYAAQPQFDCVGRLYDKDSSGSFVPGATGVLIGEKYVLSAAHCFLHYDKEYIKNTDSAGNEITMLTVSNQRLNPVASDYKFVFREKEYTAKRLIVHPKYLSKIGHNDAYEYDLIIVKLTEPVKDVTPAKLYTRYDELGKVITGVGFGASGMANDPAGIQLSGHKIAGQNTVDTFMSRNTINGHPIAMFVDFDPPEALEDCYNIGDRTPTPLEYVSAGGDSGGGCFIEEDGEWYLIGAGPGGGVEINQFLKTGYYCQTMRWLRISLFQDWISATIRQ